MADPKNNPPPDRPWRRRVRRALTIVGVVLLSVAVLAGGYVGYAAVRHARTVTLPAPTGHYRVGRVSYDWTDRSRSDPLAPTPGRPRALSTWLWYPTAATGRPAPYAPGAWNGLHFGGPLGLGETAFGAVRTHSLASAPVAAGRFPVVVLEPGLGLAAPQFTAIAENLASHGYLVAGVTPTYSANLTVLHGRAVAATAAGNPPDTDLATARGAGQGDRLVGVWAADARFVAGRVADLDGGGRFAGRVDPTHTVYIGHSLGGAASLEACRTDRRCAGAADLDGAQFGPVVDAGAGAPTLILGSADSCVTGTCAATDAEGRAERAAARTLLAATSAPVWCYTIAGTEHFNFTDYATYYLAAPMRGLVPLGPIAGARGLAITGAYLTAFLDHTLHGRSAPLLTARTAPDREVRTVHRPR